MFMSFSDFKEYLITPIKGIIHVGAHNLEEKTKYDIAGINNIVWIEANPVLCDRIKSLWGNEIKIINALISNTENEYLDFHLASDSQCSSIFELKNVKYFYSKITQTASIKLKSTKLKNLINQRKIKIEECNFINLDIQGAELEALKSLGNYIYNIDYIYTEINITELYKNCPLLIDLDKFLFNYGFIRRSLVMDKNGWGDAFYTKKSQNEQELFLQNIKQAKSMEEDFAKQSLLNKYLYPFKRIKHILLD